MGLWLTLHSTTTEFVTVNTTIHPAIKLIVLAITIILHIGLCESVSVYTK